MDHYRWRPQPKPNGAMAAPAATSGQRLGEERRISIAQVRLPLWAVLWGSTACELAPRRCGQRSPLRTLRRRRTDLRLRALSSDILRRLVFSQPFEGWMADPAVTGPCREFNLGDKLRLGPSGVLRVWPGYGDKGRGVGPGALSLRQGRSTELDRPAGADGAGIDQITTVVVADQPEPA